MRTSFPLEGTQAAIGEAALQSAHRLGWEAHLADSGQVLLVTTANGAMTLRPDDNALRVTTQRSEFGERPARGRRREPAHRAVLW